MFESWQILVIHLSLAVIFFYLLNWIGRYSVSLGYIQLSIFVRGDEAPAFNFILRTVSPTVYVVILSAFFYNFGVDPLVRNIWLVVVYYIAFRTLYNLAMARALLINWGMQIAQWMVSIPLAYFVYEKIITNKTNLLPDYESIGNELWLIIILYLYSVMNNLKTSREGTRRRKLNYIKSELAKFKNLYSEIIDTYNKHEDLIDLIYAILIYENFARPKFKRIFEDLMPRGIEITRGIMQIRSKERISDLDSVKLAVEKINRNYQEALEEVKEAPSEDFRYVPSMPEDVAEEIRKDSKKRKAIRKTVAKYNKDDDYVKEVLELYSYLEDIDEDGAE